MTLRCDFSIDMWIKGLKLEGLKSEEEAKSKIYELFSDFVSEQGLGDCKDADIVDLEAEIVEANYKVRVYNIKYSGHESEIDGFDDMTRVEQDAALDELESKLPKESILTLEDVNPDKLDAAVEDELLSLIEYVADVDSFKYEVISMN